MAKIDRSRWYAANKANGGTSGPFTPGELSRLLQKDSAAGDWVISCKGLEMGFYAQDAMAALDQYAASQDATGSASKPSETEPQTAIINADYGEFTCPVCWLKFDRGDVMHVAVHGSLRGDPILGEEQMQRFHATRFNDRGQALDAMGIPSATMACPHCRRKLPAGFLDAPHYIFSIVGAPSSGKSYYLSVLVKTLQSSLFKNFSASFRDADPTENVLLNQMKTQLFSAATPAEAQLAKTELEGAMYESLPRLGRKVRLPKPFIFQVSNSQHAHDFSVVFYDNAGEHFQPGINSSDSPGAQHIAAASAIFFLFDPLHNSEFRARLSGNSDPQLQDRRADLDQQDIILAESEVRIKSLLGMDSRQRISTPLAVIVGKCDTWLSLLDEPLEQPLRHGLIDQLCVQNNSAALRRLLVQICPAIVSNAEAISSDVMYFAVSAFGASPVKFVDAEGHHLIGPDPQTLKPMFVEVPTIWALSRIAPDLIPSCT
jgi:hypothetical protein